MNRAKRPPHAAAAHFGQRVGQQRMPIAIAPIDRQRRAVGGQLGLEGGDQGPILVVDRTAAAEMLVVLGHGQHPLARDIFAPQHVFQKRHHLVRPFGSAEGDDQHGIVGLRHSVAFSVGRPHRGNWARSQGSRTH